jgi:hypothetical protein
VNGKGTLKVRIFRLTFLFSEYLARVGVTAAAALIVYFVFGVAAAAAAFG